MAAVAGKTLGKIRAHLFRNSQGDIEQFELEGMQTSQLRSQAFQEFVLQEARPSRKRDLPARITQRSCKSVLLIVVELKPAN